MPKIIIDPTSRILYASFYIEGLYQFFGKKNVSFSSSYFSNLKRDSEEFAFEHYFAFVLINSDKKISKFVIDFCDPIDINPAAYAWCDYYAKINTGITLNESNLTSKIISIPPGFGIKIWNKSETLYNCILNLIKSKCSPIVSFKRFFKDYYEQYKRPKLEDYQNNESIINSGTTIPYVFTIAKLWDDTDSMTRTNILRKKFIEICKSMNCNFEGGFFASSYNQHYEGFKSLLFYRLYSANEYVTKTILSEIVFNTPSVHKCHGWKLGEFLAMGKPILSTPISNKLPEDLVHGETLHIVSNDEELNIGINLLLTNSDYRFRLSQKAKDYYNKNVSPFSVIKNIVKSEYKNIS